MLPEQAFFHLPEILHGSGYQQQDYETGIVGAFSLALLQVLNARNVPDPISCLQNEKLYRAGGIYPDLAGQRFLRADLFIALSRLHTATKRLSQYGWRHENWLEAKFLRGQAGENGNMHSTNKTNHVAGHLADLIRLSTLIEEPKGKSWTGRFFLHVYDADPKYYLALRSRDWLKALLKPGTHDVVIENVAQEKQSIRRLLGELPGLKIELGITNYVAFPTDSEHRPCYWFILTRIDSMKVAFEDKTFSIARNRNVTKPDGTFQGKVAAYVAGRLHIPKASKEDKPPAEPDAIDEDEPDELNGED